jgi:translation initiation factor 1 (eIF-1/SUI1)
MVKWNSMATTIYNSQIIHLFDGTELEIIPLKIKYLREFMDTFKNIKNTKGDDEAIAVLVECVRVCMKQYYPQISGTVEQIEENIDMPTIYKVLDASAGIRINKKSQEPVKDQALDSGQTWEDLDLAKLESEVFLLGIWKDYQELEKSLSMPELMATLEVSRELDYTEKKFLAAIQGVDLDGESNKNRGQKEWEDMKARVFSGGQTNDSNDVLSLQGPNAQKIGFGIGQGLDYEDLRK